MDKKQIENLLNIGVKEKWIPGYSYAIIYRDTIIKGYGGYRELFKEKVVNNEETIYDMASLTKVVITNTLLWRFIEKDFIHLNDPVKKYLKDFPYDTTIEQLATHTSGFIADIDYKIFNTKEKLEKEVMNPKLIQKPGEFAYYSDINYILLGLIFETYFKKDLNTLANQEIFLPLDMKKTSFLPANPEICAATEITKERGVVKGIVHDEKANILGGIAGHAGLFSHVDDLIPFCQMILNNGLYNGKTYLKKQTIDCWFQKQYFDKNQELERGFSWISGNNTYTTGKCVSKNTISHSGFTGTSMLIDRDNQFAFIYLTNRVHPTRNNKYFREFRKEVTDLICQTIFLEIPFEKTLQKTK